MATKPKPKQKRPREWWLYVEGQRTYGCATKAHAKQMEKIFGGEVVRVREVKR
jgi:hypothetical protein